MSPSTPPPSTWDARQIKYMGMARSDPNATLEQRRKATAALPLPKLAQGVNTREIKVKRLPLKGFEENVSGEIDALVFDPPGTHKGFDLPTLLYVHGGGYTNMSHLTHRGLTSQFALNGVRVVSIDYRLAPEAPFPAQLTDAVSAYKHLLLEDGVSEEKIFVGGDSAGGGLALSLAIWVRDHGVDEDIPMFAGLVLISPYVDLTHSSPTLTLGGNFEHDTLNAILNPEELPLYISHSKNPQAQRTNPLAAPLADNKEGLPPTFWALATADRLIGENLAMSIKRMDKLGESAHVVDIYEDQVHVFQFYQFIKQSPVFFKRSSEWMIHRSENPSSPPGPEVTFIKYDGSAQPIPEGVADLKKRLGGYLAQRNGGKPLGGARALEGEFFEAAGDAVKAKL